MTDKVCECGIRISSNSIRWRDGVCYWCCNGKPRDVDVDKLFRIHAIVYRNHGRLWCYTVCIKTPKSSHILGELGRYSYWGQAFTNAKLTVSRMRLGPEGADQFRQKRIWMETRA